MNKTDIHSSVLMFVKMMATPNMAIITHAATMIRSFQEILKVHSHMTILTKVKAYCFKSSFFLSGYFCLYNALFIASVNNQNDNIHKHQHLSIYDIFITILLKKLHFQSSNPYP